jgi:hypothetical protein
MLDTAQLARLKELTKMIEKERDHEKLTNLITELNALLDQQKKPVGKSQSE